MACRCTPLDCSRGAPRPSVSWIQPKRWAAKSVSAGRFDTFTFGTVVRVSGQRCLCTYSTVITPSPHFCGEGGGLLCFRLCPAPAVYRNLPQIRTRFRICRRCARVRMSAAGLSWTHPIRPFRGVRCFLLGGLLLGGLLPCPAKRQRTGALTKSERAFGFASSGLFHRGEKISHEWGRAVLRPMAPNIHAPGEGLAEGLRVPALAPVCAQDSGRLCRATGYKTSRFPVKFPAPLPGSAARPGQ